MPTGRLWRVPRLRAGARRGAHHLPRRLRRIRRRSGMGRRDGDGPRREWRLGRARQSRHRHRHPLGNHECRSPDRDRVEPRQTQRGSTALSRGIAADAAGRRSLLRSLRSQPAIEMALCPEYAGRGAQPGGDQGARHLLRPHPPAGAVFDVVDREDDELHPGVGRSGAIAWRAAMACRSRLDRPASRWRSGRVICDVRHRDRTITYCRVPYDVEAAARRIRENGLPRWLADRLSVGM
jgi:hypothetical protein